MNVPAFPCDPGAGGLAREAWASIAALRARAPRVHCLVNTVAQAFAANALLAAGAVPSMSIAADEVADFVTRADALLVNLGTLDAERRASLPLALDAALAAGKPVVLDPVFADASAPRLALARTLIARRPAILRLNAAEFSALAGAPADPRQVAMFAARLGITVALTGTTDVVSDGQRSLALHNGHPLMGRVSAMGCAAGALMAALAAVCRDPLGAATAALAAFGVAGEIAGESARGPGSFAPAFLDALAAPDGPAFAARARIQVLAPR